MDRVSTNPGGAASGGLTPTEFASAVTAITSAFGDPTRREIFVFAHGTQGGVTATEVAERFELHPNVARHHLDKLAAGGHLELAAARPSAGAGRPSKRYQAVDAEMTLDIPMRNDEVIIRLLGRALGELGTERAEQLAEEVGIEVGVSMAGALGADGVSGQKSVRAALHAVADALSSHGFAAHTDNTGNKLRIVSEHCPFGEAVIEHPVMCAIDRGMVRGMLASMYGETSLDLESSKPMGDEVCVTSVDS